MELAQIAQIVSTITAALLGAWAGAQLALNRFVRERAFDRRLDWYEQTVRALHSLGLRTNEAAERERENFPSDVRKQAWDDVTKAYDVLAPLLLVSELYGLPNSIRVTERIAARMSEAARAPDGVEYFSAFARELRLAASQVAGECRDHLKLKRLSASDLTAKEIEK